MPRPRKPYLHRDTDRHGNIRWYFRRTIGSPKIRIRGEYGTSEFEAAYDAALAGNPVAPKIAHKASLRWLVDRWREHSDWSSVARSTQRWRERILRKMLAANGDLPFLAITTDDIRRGKESRRDTPFAANDFLKVVGALFRWAKAEGHVKADPTEGVKMFPKNTDGHEPWTLADLDAYRAHWQVGTRQRLAMELIYWTGLRRGDAVRLGRPHIGTDGTARIRAEKTGTWLSVTIPVPLIKVLEAGPIGELTFIAGELGRPLSKESFGNMFRTWCDAAGVKASAHGLRKRAAEETAEAGATDHEMDRMFGWQTPEMSRVYTRAARDDVLAREAQEKRVKNILFPRSKSSGDVLKLIKQKHGDK